MDWDKNQGGFSKDFIYGYDPVGNPIYRQHIFHGNRVTWSYDAANQLTEELRPTFYANTFSYDPVGNRLVKVEMTAARITYAYDSANQLTTSQSSSGVTTYSFDSNGNQQLVLSPDGTRQTNTWDYENQRTLVQAPNGSRITSIYNADHRRVRKEI